jgi:ribosome-associated protein
MNSYLREAINAAQDRKALNLEILNLKGISSFTDYFVICSATSTRHAQAISDAIQNRLEQIGVHLGHVEGYGRAEWILMDYLDFVVHIFTERTREFYHLARLWKTAPHLPVTQE